MRIIEKFRKSFLSHPFEWNLLFFVLGLLGGGIIGYAISWHFEQQTPESINEIIKDGDNYAKKGEFEKAFNEYNRGIKYYPTNSEFLRKAGMALIGIGIYSKNEFFWGEFSLFPYGPTWNISNLRRLKERGVDYANIQKGLIYCDLSLQEAKTNNDIFMSSLAVGTVYFIMDNPSARDFFKKATEIGYHVYGYDMSHQEWINNDTAWRDYCYCLQDFHYSQDEIQSCLNNTKHFQYCSHSGC